MNSSDRLLEGTAQMTTADDEEAGLRRSPAGFEERRK
jgi:hypothetical protein